MRTTGVAAGIVTSKAPAARAPRVSFARVVRLHRLTILAAVALVALASVEFALYRGHLAMRAWAARSNSIVSHANAALVAALDREAAVERYRTSHDEDALTSASDASRQLTASLDSLAALTNDAAAQRARLRAAVAAIGEWNRGFADRVLSPRTAPPAAPGAGVNLFGAVRLRFAELLAAETVLHGEHHRRDLLLTKVATTGVAIPLGAAALLLIILGGRVSGGARHMLQQQQQLEEQAVELEEQAAELELQVEELGRANAELSAAIATANAEHERAQREAAERIRITARLDSALVSAPVGFAFFDHDLRYVRVNPFVAAITGQPVEAHVGKTISEMTPKANPKIEQYLRQVLETGSVIADVRVESGLAKLGSRPRQWQMTYYPVRDEAGNLLGVGNILLDVTERDLLEAQYRQAQKLEAVGRLAGGVAHDFNNLLTVIRSYCDLVLLELPEGSAGRLELQEIGAAADRAATLARQLLSFSSKQVILPRVLDVNVLVRGLDAMLRRLLSAPVRLELRLGEAVGAVRADPSHLEQVLMNLVVNASDAMADKGGRLSIETSNVVLDEHYARGHVGVAPGDYVMIAVSDTGVGMDDETRQRIFEPFFTTKEPGKGTGLGLSTVYGIVHQLAGHIWVYSEVGAGTTFKVYLPRSFAPVDAAEIGAAPAAGAVHASGATLLVVEDEDAVRASLVKILERQGYRVLAAVHGGDALRLANGFDGDIHLVVSDLMMPEMGGREFVSRLVRARPRARVLFMSGFTDDEVMLRGLVNDGHAFIQKPFSIDQISRRVRELLQT